MDSKKLLKLKELKKKFGYDIAVLKQIPDYTGLSDEDLYKSLLLFQIQNLITDSINDYAQAVDHSESEMATLVAMLFATSGEIIGNISGHDSEAVISYRKIAIGQFDRKIKDLINGTQKPQ